MTRTVITFFALLNLTWAAVHACSCVGYPTVEDQIKSADAVVVATALTKEITLVKDFELIKLFSPDSSARDKFPYSLSMAKYKFKVETVYKGNTKSDTIEVMTGLGGGDCGNRFDIGARYIIYGSTDSYMNNIDNKFDYPTATNLFWTNICTRTRLYDQVEIDAIEKVKKRNN